VAVTLRAASDASVPALRLPPDAPAPVRRFEHRGELALNRGLHLRESPLRAVEFGERGVESRRQRVDLRERTRISRLRRSEVAAFHEVLCGSVKRTTHPLQTARTSPAPGTSTGAVAAPVAVKCALDLAKSV
jgi:hypothetical protein